MAKPVKTQWDFGELFAEQTSSAREPAPAAPAPAAPPPLKPSRKVLSVTELTAQIRRILEGQIGHVWVTGEITNLRNQTSGHIYFTLKDANAQLSCVLFRGELFVDRTLLDDGRKVTLGGELTIYKKRGQYQLRVTQAELQGAGALQAAFERLKQKLNAEGLFAKERKRPLPRYPQRIGLVTSPTGAAIRDVLHVIERRNPSLEIILVPCRVQGEGAGAEVARSIRLLNEFHLRGGVQSPSASVKSTTADRKPKVQSQNPLTSSPAHLDLILVTRGGGSLEDLWAFNEEVVARAIFESQLPVVSAVGHEIDFTISDFVADVRAATPSAAAEIITEGVFASRQLVVSLTQRMLRMHPRRQLNEHLQRLDDLQTGLQRQTKQGVNERLVTWKNLASRLRQVRPKELLKQRRELLKVTQKRLHDLARAQFKNGKSLLAAVESRLRLLGPEQVLARGYSITLDAATGQVLRDAAQVKAGQQLKTRLKKGEVSSR